MIDTTLQGENRMEDTRPPRSAPPMPCDCVMRRLRKEQEAMRRSINHPGWFKEDTEPTPWWERARWESR